MVEREKGKVFADEIVVGMWIIPPDRTTPVEVVGQLTDPGANVNYFEFACLGPRGGRVAVGLNRWVQVEVVPKKS